MSFRVYAKMYGGKPGVWMDDVDLRGVTYFSPNNTGCPQAVKSMVRKRFPHSTMVWTNLMSSGGYPQMGRDECFLHAWRVYLTGDGLGSVPPPPQGLVVVVPPLSFLTSFEMTDHQGKVRSGGLYTVTGALEKKGVIFQLSDGGLNHPDDLNAYFWPRKLDDPAIQAALTEEVRVRLDQLLDRGLA